MPYGKYFSYLPTIPYTTFDDTNQYKVVTNIFKRVRATLEARTDRSVYYEYRVRDGQKPEDVAYNYYGYSTYHWVLLLMNEIRDPQWCWPLDSQSFENYIINKYGSIETAATQTSHYETNEFVAQSTDDNYTKGDIILEAGMIVKSDFTYQYTQIINGSQGSTISHNTPVREVKSLEKEISENEKRADIILLKKAFLREFIESFEELVVVKR